MSDYFDDGPIDTGVFHEDAERVCVVEGCTAPAALGSDRCTAHKESA